MINNVHLSVLIEQQAAKYGEKVALRYRDYEKNAWQTVSWTDFSAQVLRVSRALLSCSVERQERVAIFSQNKPECLYVAFGCYGINAVTTPFYPTSSGAQVSYMMNDAEVRILFVGEQQQYDTAMDVVSLCKSLERIVIFDRSVKLKDGDSISVYLDEFLQMGETDVYDAEMKKRKDDAKFEDMADILYTSGTTGDSKGVILTYKMYRAAFKGNDSNLPVDEKDVVLNFLPLTHVFERGWAYLCLTEGAELALNLRPADVLTSLQEVRPTCMA